MMIKEVDRTANVAWSPGSAPLPIYLAAGTAAQQLDATFSTSSAMEIYELNVQEPGLEMTLKGSVVTEHRFHKVAWGARGGQADNSKLACDRGVIVGGCDGGNLFVYDVNKILSSTVSDDALLFRGDKHSGPVRSLDFNPFQTNLLASGAGESEILVWDLSNPTTPMTPGARSQPPDDVTSVAWNCQVQHILASTFGTRCVVWDLRKNEPIIKVSNSTTRMRCKVVCWHPNVATQMCLASEDDHTPFIQLWDLRFATSPIKTLENHQKGVLSLAWCPQDPDLLLSCGKDCRILVWNPNSDVVGGEVVCEIPTSNQWSFDVAWCPRNPAILSSSSFDGHISIYSLMGGVQNVKPDAKVTAAFMDVNNPFQQQQQQQVNDFIPTPVFLTKPPKWCRRPVGASFGFGGKLVSFNSDRQQATQSQGGHGPNNESTVLSLVHISQVITEPDLVERAVQLENVIDVGQYAEFCEKKTEAAKSDEQQQVWNFLRAHFDADPKRKFLTLLGHNPGDFLYSENDQSGVKQLGAPVESSSSLINNPDVLFDNIASDTTSEITISIPKSSDISGLVTRMLLVGDLSGAVDECIRSKLLVEGLLLATAGGQDLLEKTQKKYFQMKKNDGLTGLISAVVTRNWSRVINTCSLDDWKQVLAGTLVYSRSEEFAPLCEALGRRLEVEGGNDRINEAMLCYVCSASVSGLVDCWSRATVDLSNPDELQNLVEQLTVLKRVAQNNGPTSTSSSVTLSRFLYRYASVLAAQGKLSTALLHLEPSDEESVALLQNRLSRALHVQTSPQATVITPQHRTTLVSNVNRPSTRPVSLQQRQTPMQSGQQFQQQPAVVQGYPQRKDGIPFSPVYPVPSQTTNQHNPRGPDIYTPPQLNEPLHPYGQRSGPIGGNRFPSEPPTVFTPAASAVPPYNSNPQFASATTSGSLYQTNYQQTYQNNQTLTQPQPSSENYGSTPYAPVENIQRSGWNDPPPQLVKPAQSEQQKQQQNFERPAPITHPLYGTAPTDQTYNSGWMPGPPPPPSQQQQQQQQQQQYQFNPATQQNYINPDQIVPPAQTPPSQYQPQQKQLPATPIPKTVPAEHQVLFDVLEVLKILCLQTANSMPMKRKLEDVSRKLDILYDKLRDNELSPNTTSGLHQIIEQVTQQRDYATALQIHAQIVSTGAFSEIGGFMPALKYLLQAAHQLAISV